LKPFAALEPADERALLADGEQVLAYLGPGRKRSH
jgi:hypothetical protein